MCRSCATRARFHTAEHREKLAAAMRRRWDNPQERERLATSAKIGLNLRLQNDPEFAARRLEQCRANGRKSAKYVNTPAGSPTRVKAGLRNSDTKMGWCPLEYRADYRRLRINDGFSAAAARQIIEQQVKIDADRYAATGQLQRSAR